MSTISWSQLETARKSPTDFAKSLGSNNARFSKYMTWQLAIHEYHKQHEDLSKSINYFENMFTKNFADNSKNNAERDEWMGELDAYAKDHKKLKLVHIESKKTVTVPIVASITVGGHLTLIKMNNKGGYSVYFFSKDSTEWEDELRFPIVQGYVADTLYNVDSSEVDVGIYAIDNQKHQSRNYSSKEIDDARKELRKIGRAVLRVL